MQAPSRTELPLTSASSSGCGCCSTEASQTPQEITPGVEYSVEGLTCGGCKASVEKAVNAVEGVDAATVVLVPGGNSSLVVSGKATLAAIRDAVTSAGYSLTS
ncbi:heavy-metal-associated domain-containing protein [Arthrobacter sp. ISL-95]|uniref:heavy-metal-associated domain-containing protein n=1 Tax=Arthrobacter sp. ISL-95 TaxID=2819116 RepID=UPI001BE67097|nr:heavy-metal-associated domain-containing protein [Arthrobacter sp. ISL-95]MBT2588381.1 heavy-metal-associated domain-containing protein [Arthrobacter sp. ISL-95]